MKSFKDIETKLSPRNEALAIFEYAVFCIIGRHEDGESFSEEDDRSSDILSAAPIAPYLLDYDGRYLTGSDIKTAFARNKIAASKLHTDQDFRAKCIKRASSTVRVNAFITAVELALSSGDMDDDERKMLIRLGDELRLDKSIINSVVLISLYRYGAVDE
jgi:hypothetical protein